MSAENENKEILSEVCKALDNIDAAKQMLNSLEFSLKYMREVLKNTEETRYDNICGLFYCEGDVVSKDYLLYDLNDDLESIVSNISKVFETMPLFEEESK